MTRQAPTTSEEPHEPPRAYGECRDRYWSRTNIGRAIALKLAAAGAAVVVNSRSNHEETQGVVREITARGVEPFLSSPTSPTLRPSTGW
jgi:hypothetical protein